MKTNGKMAKPNDAQTEASSGMEMTETERLKMENFALRHQILQQQLQQIVAERAAYIKQIEAAHPGSEWDERQGLVAVEYLQPPA